MQLLNENDDFAALIVSSPIELKFADTSAVDAGVIEGWGSVFGNTDSHGDVVQPGAFAESLAKHHAAGTSPAMLWHHRGAEPIGKWIGMGEDARGLRVRGQLNLDSARGREAHAHIKAGDVTGLSIGYSVPPGGQTRQSNGSRLLSKLHVHEVSVTPIPSNEATRIVSVKSLESRGELEDLLQAAGLPRGAARKLAAGGWPALSTAAAPALPDPALKALSTTLDRALLELKSMLKGNSHGSR
jgi:HK97 family phage prohead protease